MYVIWVEGVWRRVEMLKVKVVDAMRMAADRSHVGISAGSEQTAR
jgi:hypothetical protein